MPKKLNSLIYIGPITADELSNLTPTLLSQIQKRNSPQNARELRSIRRLRMIEHVYKITRYQGARTSLNGISESIREFLVGNPEVLRSFNLKRPPKLANLEIDIRNFGWNKKSRK